MICFFSITQTAITKKNLFFDVKRRRARTSSPSTSTLFLFAKDIVAHLIVVGRAGRRIARGFSAVLRVASGKAAYAKKSAYNKGKDNQFLHSFSFESFSRWLVLSSFHRTSA